MEDSNLEQVKERVFEFIKYLGISDAEFMRCIKKQKAEISHWRTGSSKFNQKAIPTIIATFPELNGNWLVRGEGNMILSRAEQKKYNTQEDYVRILEEQNATYKKHIELLEKQVKDVKNTDIKQTGT